MSIKQLSIFVENKSGSIADITQYLAEKKIDIRALSVADTADYGILRIIVDQPEKAAADLQMKTSVALTDVLAVRMEDRPGSLNEIIHILAKAQIGIEYMYAFLCKVDKQAALVLRVADTAGAERLLRENGYEELDESAF